MVNEKIDILKNKALTLVTKPGVYLMKDIDGNIIYIGKAKNLKNRVVSYFRHNKSHNNKVLKMVSLVDDFDYIVTDSEFEALVLECSLIKQYTPKYNILLKDDKGYHYVQITNEPYPKIKAVKQKTDKNATYLGPYTSSFWVKQAVDDVNKAFMLPHCNKKFPKDFKKTRPCLNYYINNCAGICKGNISEEEYNQIIEQAVDYLKNGSTDSIQKLTNQMYEASENLNFEKAAKLRDRINAIKNLSETQKVFSTSHKSQDFIGIITINTTALVVVMKFRDGSLNDKDDFTFEDCYDEKALFSDFITQYYQKGNYIPKVISAKFELEDNELYESYLSKLAEHKVSITSPQKGEQKKLIDMVQNNALEELSQKLNRASREVVALKELAGLLGLPKIPEYIESYDISNLQNDYMVAGMVVFENGKPKKSAYKRFSMKETVTQDDYACMREVITRRFNKYFDESVTDEGFKRKPDLILLDGGNGHVGVVLPVLKSFGLDTPTFGMVKDSKHRTRAIAVNGGEIQISSHKSAFRLVTQIQDEVHRFAISYQRNKHKKVTFSMGLTTVKGIGEKKAQALIKHFKTKKALKEASIDEIKAVAKVDGEVLTSLYEKIKIL